MSCFVCARDAGTEEVDEALITVKDEIVPYGLHKMAANIVSVDMILENSGLCKVLCSCHEFIR